MADYRPETCAYCLADTWCEIRSSGKPQCRACKVERFFARVLYPPLGYRLLAWQKKVLRDIYGNVSLETGRRKYRTAYVSVGKKNGKSFLIGGLPIYHLLMEDERNPEAYGAAAAKDQASLVFKAAAQLVAANTHLQSRLKVLPSTKRILRRDGGGFYPRWSASAACPSRHGSGRVSSRRLKATPSICAQC
jgi:phage terminase large subunit-like protein